MRPNPQQARILDSILSDPLLRERLAPQIGAAAQAGGLEGVSQQVLGNSALEAIVLLEGRPALVIENGSFDPGLDAYWTQRLVQHRKPIEYAIGSVGRVDIRNHVSYSWLGTAWLIEEDVVVTNRHVASVFAKRGLDWFLLQTNPRGDAYDVLVDFRLEHNSEIHLPMQVKDIVFLAEYDGRVPDVALLRVAKQSELKPIELFDRFDFSEPGQYIAAIGYPAKDFRNPKDALIKVFGEIYDVKRLSPGVVLDDGGSGFVFEHDCSTLGGSSGSAVIDIATGKAVGLHFGGTFQQGNYAVKAKALLDILANGSAWSVLAPIPEIPTETKPIDFYKDCKGYDQSFLGFDVPLPILGEVHEDDLATLKDPHTARKPFLLDYVHYSVVMNKRRKLPFFTAVNIDGKEWRTFPRKADLWLYDPRLDLEFQAGSELYARTPFDRGHLVRRQDPDWGDFATAKLADDMTFHFTNCAPQHRDINRKVWLRLEEYVLANASEQSLKISVFTGPIFRETDPPDPATGKYQIPVEFWKLVVCENELNGSIPSATAYVISQRDLVQDSKELFRPLAAGEEFMYAAFRTFQVRVTDVEHSTGLSFGELRTHDPLAKVESTGGILLESESSVVI